MIVSEILSRIRDWIKTGIPLNVKSSNVRTLLTWMTIRMDYQETGRLKVVKIAGNTATEQEVGDRVSGIIENTPVVNGIYLGGNISLLSSYYIPNLSTNNPTENIYDDIPEMLSDQSAQTQGYNQRVLDDSPYSTGEAVYLYRGTANGNISDYIKLSEGEVALDDFTPTGGYTGTAQDIVDLIANAGGLQSVTGDGVDNTDPLNPVIDLSGILANLQTTFDARYRPLHDRLIKKLDVTGTYVFDLLSGETWRLTMVGNTTFSIGTKPPANFTKTVTAQMDGNFAPTWSAELSAYKTGSYDGTKLNTLVIEYVEGTMTKFQITQND